MEKIIDYDNPPSKNYNIISITLIVIGWIAVFTYAGTAPTSARDGYFSSMILLAAIPATIGLCGVLFAESKITQRICVIFAFLSPLICYIANILIFTLIGNSIGEQYNGFLALLFQIILSISFIYFVFHKKMFTPYEY